MDTRYLSDKSAIIRVRQNRICFVLCCLLLISIAGCSQPAERDALKQLDEVIEWQLAKEENPLQEDKVLVALYLDADEIKDSRKMAEYRCYDYYYRGYSGIKNVPIGSPWSTWENIRSRNLKMEIVIDPGPPYKNFSQIVNLIPGEVTNLGYIVLEKVEYEGTASILGTVRDENNSPIKGVEVSSEKGVSVTDSNGFYRIDGFELDTYDVTAQKDGYVPVTTRFEIRDMEARIIEKDVTLSLPRKIRLRYVITPKEKNDFTGPAASSGTVEFLLDKSYMEFPIDLVDNGDFRLFLKQTAMGVRLSNGMLTLSPSYLPIFFEKLRSSFVDFDSIKGVAASDDQRCPPVEKGDIILIAGGERRGYTVTNYMVKILFEQIQPVYP